MEIQINRKVVIVAVAIIGLLVGATVAITTWHNQSATNSSQRTSVWIHETQEPAHNKPDEAAVRFVKAFYTADHRDLPAWLASLKPLSTEDGYVLIQRSITPVLWPKLTAARAATDASQVMAADEGLLVEGYSPIGGMWQVRAIHVTVDAQALWPTMKSQTFTAHVMLGQQDGEWRFVSFVTSEQIDQLVQLKGEQPQ